MSKNTSRDTEAAFLPTADQRPTMALVSKLLLGVEAFPVRFMYRTVQAHIKDTGWRLYSGYEDDSFLADKSNMQPCPLQPLVEADPGLLELLQGKPGCVWERAPGEDWQQVTDFVIPTEGDEVLNNTYISDLDQFSQSD